MSRARLMEFLSEIPLVAVLRGIRPHEAAGIGEILIDEGFRIVEVPMNSPDALESIATLARLFGARALVGAGTITERAQLEALHRVGGRLAVSPHFDRSLVETSEALGLVSLPGVATPSEAFAALHAGAHALKLFPTELATAPVLRAMRAVLPKDAVVLPVGGVDASNMAELWQAGASGFGVGSALYRAGHGPNDVRERARGLVTKMRRLQN